MIMKLLSDYIGDAGSIIGEVEDPKSAKNEEERMLRIRRMEFYIRNGCYDTGVRVRCFGVEFIILGMGALDLSGQKCWDMYSSFYKAVLPRDMYDENIELLPNMP